MPKQANQPKDEGDNKDNKKPTIDPQRARTYARYSGMAFQMGITILLGVLAGIELDKILHTKPFLTVFFALFSIFAALYIALKDFFVDENKKKKDE